MFYYSQINSIPVITLSNNYDFREREQKNSSPSAAFESFPSFSSTSSSKTKGIQILTPGKGQAFSNQKPVLKGKGTPNQNVQITIHSSQQIQATVNTDANGNWSYQPNAPLSPGSHTITVTAKDSLGVLQTITQAFTVYAAETSPTPTTETNTPTPTLTVATANPSPSDSLTLTATPRQPLPQTGNTSIITAGIVGLLITVVGGLIFLLSRKGI